MKELKNVEEFESLKKNNELILLEFSASWCGPCKAILPILEELSQEFSEVVFAKIDIDTLSVLADTFNVEGVPTMVFLKNGEEVDRQVGGMGKKALKTWLTKSVKCEHQDGNENK